MDGCDKVEEELGGRSESYLRVMILGMEESSVKAWECISKLWVWL